MLRHGAAPSRWVASAPRPLVILSAACSLVADAEGLRLATSGFGTCAWLTAASAASAAAASGWAEGLLAAAAVAPGPLCDAAGAAEDEDCRSGNDGWLHLQQVQVQRLPRRRAGGGGQGRLEVAAAEVGLHLQAQAPTVEDAVDLTKAQAPTVEAQAPTVEVAKVSTLKDTIAWKGRDHSRPKWKMVLLFVGLVIGSLIILILYRRCLAGAAAAADESAMAAKAKAAGVAGALAAASPPAAGSPWAAGGGEASPAAQRSPGASAGRRTPTEGSGEVGFAEDRARLKLTVFVATLCHFCMGYNTGIIAGALLYIEVAKEFAPLDSWTVGMLVGSMLVGSGIGAAFSIVADWIGRRLTLLGVAVTYCVGGVIMCVASEVEWLALGRAIAGIGVGVSSGLVTLYISEMEPGESKGQLGGWAPMMGNFGILVAYIVSLILGFIPGGAWRWQLGLGIAPAVCVLLLAKLLPETPRWLLSAGRRQEAHAVLSSLFPSVSQRIIKGELDQIAQDIAAARGGKQAGYLEICNKYRRPFGVAIAINVLQQVSGINVVIYFGPTVLKIAGFSNLGALITTVAISFGQLFTVLANVALIDRIGRRPVAIAGIVVIMLGQILLVGGFLLRAVTELSMAETVWMVVLGMFLFRAAFSFSMSPLPYMMSTEIFPPEARAVGLGISWMANSGANFVICLTFPVVEDALAEVIGEDYSTASVFGFYLACTLGALAFVVAFLPETASQKRLEAVTA